MIDLRTDALTPPTEAMWRSMRKVEMGWAGFREDHSVNMLESLAAEMLEKEAAIFLPTCTMANLLALITQGESGTRVMLEASSHIARSEEWGAVSVAGLLPHLFEDPEYRAVEQITAAMQLHPLPRMSIFCVENTHNNGGGAAIHPEIMDVLVKEAHRCGAKVHLDGARLFNAAARLNIALPLLVKGVDSVAISINKGLCAPVGALLCGTRKMIDAARVNARRLGGATIHKAGIFAAAGLIALTEMFHCLHEDNRRASEIATELSHVPGLSIRKPRIPTNIILLDGAVAASLANHLLSAGILTLKRPDGCIRLVTHHLIDDDAFHRVAKAIQEFAR